MPKVRKTDNISPDAKKKGGKAAPRKNPNFRYVDRNQGGGSRQKSHEEQFGITQYVSQKIGWQSDNGKEGRVGNAHLQQPHRGFGRVEALRTQRRPPVIHA